MVAAFEDRARACLVCWPSSSVRHEAVLVVARPRARAPGTLSADAKVLKKKGLKGDVDGNRRFSDTKFRLRVFYGTRRLEPPFVLARIMLPSSGVRWLATCVSLRRTQNDASAMGFFALRFFGSPVFRGPAGFPVDS